MDRGMIAIDARIFSEIVRKLPDSDITIETDDSLQTVITCEKAKFRHFRKTGRRIFLPSGTSRKKILLTISQFTLKEVIRQTIFSIADTESNKMMTGELI